MEFTDLFDQQTLDAILADAKEAGIDAEDVEKVLRTIPNGGSATPTRSANPEGQLMSLMGDDQDAVTDAVSQAAGVERGKTSTILMLAAPFLLKYLLGNNNSGNSSASLLGSLLGMGSQTQSMGSMGSLLSLLGGGSMQPQSTSLTSSLLGSLMGGGVQQPAYSTNNTASLLSSLMGGAAAQPVQQNNMGGLLNLMGGAAQPTQTQSAGGGLMNALFGLLGDM